MPRSSSAAVVHLVSLTAIRAGGEAYAREHGTRGATTLLKSNVTLAEGLVTLQFKAKGGKAVVKEVRDIRLRAAMQALMALPGRRLFQYRDAEGAVHAVRAGDVNAYLCGVAGRRLSLKDFRTLVASAAVLEALAATEPASSERARRSQLRSAVTAVAEELANTPTVCRKSYVHEAVVTAFEQGALARLRKPTRSPIKKAEVLARIVARHRLLDGKSLLAPALPARRASAARRASPGRSAATGWPWRTRRRAEPARSSHRSWRRSPAGRAGRAGRRA